MSDVRRWAALAWSDHDWKHATLAHGAFHDVAVLAPTVVGRVAIGSEPMARTQRESRILQIVSALGLPLNTPRVLGDPVHAGGIAGQLLTFVSGRQLQDAHWTEVRDGLAELLGTLRDAGTARRHLPGPRLWCGGGNWLALVRDQLAPRLPAPIADLASSVAEDALAAEIGVEKGLVHGDLGLHNVMWSGRRVTGLIDFDHAAFADPAIDVAPLVGVFGSRRLAEIVDIALLTRAMLHRATLALQVAAAAELTGRVSLRDHALGNFATRADAGTLYDPDGAAPR